ncbi:MAG: CBS domain-containing protein [Euryarchaeota archaeon]|nr:CBS domain-containing protein [Euryarchaeota archaeon]
MVHRTKVKEIHRLLTTPSVIEEGASPREVVTGILANPKTRALYVIDDDKKLAGIIVLKNILKSAFLESIPEPYLSFSALMHIKPGAKTAKNLMIPPVYAKEEDIIKDAFIRMTTNDLEEIPVVDDNLKVIGDLNMLEILNFWKERAEE